MSDGQSTTDSLASPLAQLLPQRLLLSSESWRAPDTNAASFEVLADHGVFDHALASRLAKAVGFRNILVHQYGEVDDDLVIARLDDLVDLEAFVDQVTAWAANA